MRPTRLTQRLLEFTGWFTIGVVAVISFVSVEDPTGRWVAAGLALAFAVVDMFCPGAVRSRYVHAFYAVQTAIAIALMSLQPNVFAAPVLFFVLSAQVMVNQPLRQAALWIAVFVVVTGVFLVSYAGLVNGLFSLLVYAAGFSFFGAFGRAMRDASDAQQESQRLLEELRAAQSQLHQLAIAEERNRLARELHDALGHRLTVAVVQLEGAQRLIPSDPERAGRMIGAMREQMKEALGDLRRTVATLRTPLEADLPLDQSLKQLTHSFQEATGLRVQLTLPAELPPLPEAHRLALYRAAQESLTNAQRHAQARNIQLAVTAADARVTLIATDDGQGLPADLNDGFGLKGLQERAALLGGECAVENHAGGGAQVRFVLPLEIVNDRQRTMDDERR